MRAAQWCFFLVLGQTPRSTQLLQSNQAWCVLSPSTPFWTVLFCPNATRSSLVPKSGTVCEWPPLPRFHPSTLPLPSTNHPLWWPWVIMDHGYGHGHQFSSGVLYSHITHKIWCRLSHSLFFASTRTNSLCHLLSFLRVFFCCFSCSLLHRSLFSSGSFLTLTPKLALYWVFSWHPSHSNKHTPR